MKFLALVVLFVSTNLSAAQLPEYVQKLWEKRADIDSLKECLIHMDALYRKTPQDRDILVYLSRGYFLKGELTLDNESEKKAAYEKSKDFGLKALSLNNEFKKHADGDLQKAASKLNKEDAPAAFWTAAAIGRWSAMNGVMSSLEYKDPMLALVKKVEEHQPDYFYGAVYRFWAGFYALAPGIVGGDMKKSKEYFEKAQSLYPEYIGTKVAKAEQYYVEKDDEKSFKQTLEEVVAAPISGPKEIAPENFLEQKKAEMLLKKRKEIF